MLTLDGVQVRHFRGYDDGDILGSAIHNTSCDSVDPLVDLGIIPCSDRIEADFA